MSIVLEANDDDFAKIEKIFAKVGSGFELLRFKTLADFGVWFKKFVEDPESFYEDENDEFICHMLLGYFQIVNNTHFSLLRKISTYFHKHRHLPEGFDQLPIVISVRDVDEFDVEDYMDPIVGSLLFKPIDHALWPSQIDWAISGIEAQKNETVYQREPKSMLEMLKDIKIDRLSEIGFRSNSMNPIAPGSFGKYYFKEIKKYIPDNGYYARCTKSIPDPNSNGSHLNSFTFFGLTEAKHEALKKFIKDNNDGAGLPFDDEVESDPIGMVVLAGESRESKEVVEFLKGSYQNIKVAAYDNFMEFFAEADSNAALEMLGERFKDAKPLTLEFLNSGNVFKKAFYGDNPDELIHEYIGLEKEQLDNFKNVVLGALKTEERKQFANYFMKTSMDDMTIAVDVKGERVFFTILGSEIKEDEETKSEYIHLTIAPPTEDAFKKKMEESRRIPDNFRVLIVCHSILRFKSVEFWASMKKRLVSNGVASNLMMFGVGETEFSSYDEAKSYQGLDDMIFEPIDHNYFRKRLKHDLPGLKLSSDHPSERRFIEGSTEAKVGIPTKVKLVSEVSLTAVYPRAVERGAFREFVLDFPRENTFVELRGKLVQSEQVKKSASKPDEPDRFLNYFLFFGHGDQVNQKIRKWAYEEHVNDSKEEDEGGEEEES